DYDRVSYPFQHSPIHQHERKRKNHHCKATEKIGESCRTLIWMSKVNTKKTAAIRSQLFPRHGRRYRSGYNRLLLGLTIVPCSHRPWFERRNLIVALKGHRGTLLQKHQRQHKGDREKEVN